MWLASSPEASSRYLSGQKGLRTEQMGGGGGLLTSLTGDVASENCQGQLGTMLDFGIWSEI